MMAQVIYKPPDGFMTVGQAEAYLQVSRTTMHRMLREGKLATYRDQRNKRVKLVRVEDVESLVQPVPNGRRR